MKTFVVGVLIFTSGMAVFLFLLLWFDRGFDEAWAVFERLVGEAIGD